MFMKLDDKVKAEKKPQARRQMKRRVMGQYSERLYSDTGIPKWAVQA